MTRLRWLLALPALLIATSGPLMAAEIKDKAGIVLRTGRSRKPWSPSWDRVEQDYKVPVTIETVESLNGDPISEVLTTNHAPTGRALKGIYILIAKAMSLEDFRLRRRRRTGRP